MLGLYKTWSDFQSKSENFTMRKRHLYSLYSVACFMYNCFVCIKCPPTRNALGFVCYASSVKLGIHEISSFLILTAFFSLPLYICELCSGEWMYVICCPLVYTLNKVLLNTNFQEFYCNTVTIKPTNQKCPWLCL